MMTTSTFKNWGFAGLALAVLLGGQEARAYCISGKLQYVNNWSTNGLGARLSGVNGATRPLRGVQITWTRIAGGAAKSVSIFTNASGNYQACQAQGMTVGTWQPTIRWGDQAQKFRLVAETNGLTLVSVAPPGISNVTITNSNKVADGLFLASAVYPTEQANAYDAAYEWFDTMGGKYELSSGATSALWSGMGTIQVVNQPTQASAGVRRIRVPFATPTVANTFFHELGHVLQINFQQQATGCDFFDCSWSDASSHTPACQNPATGQAHDTASEALVEGWADFIANVVSADGTPPTSVGSISAVCRQCSVNPVGGNPNVPACGTGSLARSRSNVARALGDLVDNQSTVSGCATESVRLTVKQVVSVMANRFGAGFDEGESGESNPSAGTTPGVGNSTLKEDGLSLLDFLHHVEQAHGVSTRAIWANSCWQPGDAAQALTN